MTAPAAETPGTPGSPADAAVEKIIDNAYTAVARAANVERAGDSESWETALYYALGEGVFYSKMRDVVRRAVKDALTVQAAGQLDAGLLSAEPETPAVTFEKLDDLLDAWESYHGDVSHFIQTWMNHINKGTPLDEL